MEMYINIHTHRPGYGVNILDTCLGMPDEPAVGKVYLSAGIHPQFINGQEEETLAHIRTLAENGEIVAVGECGMDRTAEADLALQAALFEQQAIIAAEYDLPVIIHGVRAVSELSAIAKRWGKDKKWIMHGFNNRREVLQDLLRHDIYISVGRHVMNDDSNVCRLLAEIPLDRMFLETDNSACDIRDIYAKVAGRLDIPVEQLQQCVCDNFQRLFYKMKDTNIWNG